MNPRLQAVRRCAALKLLRTRVLYPVAALHLPGEGQMQSGRAGSAPDNKLRQSPQQAALRLQSAYSASRDSFLKMARYAEEKEDESMKCPHCYCNYDDSERECPMCGTRSNVAACQNAKHKSVVYNGSGGKRNAPQPGRAAAGSQRHPAGNAAPRRTSANAGRTARGDSWEDAAKAAKKRRKKTLLWIVVVFVLIELLPLLVGVVNRAIYGIRRDMEYRDDGIHIFDDGTFHWPDASTPAAPEPEDTPDLPEPEDTPDDEITDNEDRVDGIVQGGDFYCEETELYFTFDFSNDAYWLSVGDYLETGNVFAIENDPATDPDYFNDEFPAAEYDSYVLYLDMDEEWTQGGEHQSTLVVLYTPRGEEPADHFYLNNTYADAQWLPLDRAILLEHWG